MILLGIDPGLARVGYAIIDITRKTKSIIDCGVIITSAESTEEKRLLEIHQDLLILINKWNPDYAAVEKFFFYRSSTTISVVQARGVINMTMALKNIPILEFAPVQIKLAVTGSGKSNKQEITNAVMREFNLNKPPKPDDAADAVAIALTAWLKNLDHE